VGEQEQYLAACYWLHKALLSRAKTEALLALVVTIESFLLTDSERCSVCGQPKHKLSARFCEFLLEYAGPDETADAASIDGFRQLVKRLYGLRSRVIHTGHVVGAEDVWLRLGFVPHDVISERDIEALRTFCARALLNWLMDKSKAGDENEARRRGATAIHRLPMPEEEWDLGFVFQSEAINPT
jgi:hypothetical protein